MSQPSARFTVNRLRLLPLLGKSTFWVSSVHALLIAALLLSLLPAPQAYARPATAVSSAQSRTAEANSVSPRAQESTQPQAPVAVQADTISIQAAGFVPGILIVTPGTEITWRNDDTVAHQVREGSPPTLENETQFLFLPMVQLADVTSAQSASLFLPAVHSGGSAGRVSASPALQSPANPQPPAPRLPAQSAAPVSDHPNWESGSLAPGESFRHTFNEVGTFAYYDPANPTLAGQIVVEAQPQPNQPPTIAIDSPVADAVVGSSVLVAGRVSDDKGVQSVSVNGVAASLAGNDFSATISLAGGNQTISAAAIDTDGATAAASRVVRVDRQGPLLTIAAPATRQSVTTRQPFISIQYGDFDSSVATASLTARISSQGIPDVSVVGDLTVTGSGASGTLSTPLTGGHSYTLTVSLADAAGNSSSATSAFYVPTDPDSITPPEQTADGGWVSGSVYNSTTCDVDLTTCAGLPGAQVTLEKINPTAVQQIRDSRARAIESRWQRSRAEFVPLSPLSTAAALAVPITGTVVTGPDGFFAFPVLESGHYWLRVEADGFTYAQREVQIVAEHHTATNALYLTPLDSAVTTCDASGCDHTNSDGTMQVVVPAGAIGPGDNLDVTATVFDQVEFLPSGDLPPGTWETYAFNLGGDSDYIFQPGTEVTVRIANSKGFAPGTPIPLGFWNHNTLAWEHAGTGVVDGSGQWVEMSVTHFSNYDCNDPISVPEIDTEVADQTDDDDIQECPAGENGCFVSLQKGTLGEAVELPAVQVLGESVAPSLVYNSERTVPSQVLDMRLSLDIQGSVTLGDSIGFELFIEGEKTDDFTFSADLQPGEVGRFRYLWDGRNAQGQLLPPGLYPYTARFRVPYQGEYCYALNGIFGNPPDCVNGGTGVFISGEKVLAVEGTVELNTQLDSPYGAGWVLSGQQRLYADEAGRILITDGDRSVEFYAPAQNALAQASGLALAGGGVVAQAESIPAPSARSLPADVAAYDSVRAADSTIVQGFIAADTTWTQAGSPYVITSTVVVNDNITLTIEPGVEVQVNAGHSLYVLGILKAVGNAGSPITFGPVSGNADGSWTGVSIGGGAVQTDSDASQLQHLTIRGGGTNLSITDSFPTLADVILQNAAGGQLGGIGQGLSVVQIQRTGTLTLQRLTSRNNAGGGVSLAGGNYVLDSLTVQSNSGIGLSVSDASSQVTLRDSTIQGNLSTAILPAQVVLQNNTFANNATNVIAWIGGVIDRNLAWDVPGIDGYQILGTVTVQPGNTLSVPAGTPVTFAGPNGVALDVQGALQAIGTAEQPVVFSSSTQANARTGQIDLRGSGSQLSNVTIQGLGGQPGALNIYGNTPQLDGIRVSQNITHGIYVENGGSLALHNSVLAGNGSHGLFNATPAQQVDATNNYWGAQSGPLHPSLNPSGAGNQVSDGVLFNPWLPVPPEQAGTIQDRTAHDFSELRFDENSGTYSRHYPDGTVVHFTSAGFHDFTETRVGTRIGYVYNGDGSTATVAITAPGKAGPDWVWTFDYSGGRLTGIADPAGRTTDFSVNGKNQLRRVTFPDSSERAFFYDQQGLMTQQTDQMGDTTSYTYDSFGRIRTVTEPPRPVFDPAANTVTVQSEVRTFTPSDTAYPLLNQSAVGTSSNPAPAPSTTAALMDRVEYGNGTVSGHTNKWGLWDDRTDGVGRTSHYQWDANNNLLEETLPNGDCVAYTYDANGNRTSVAEFPAAECAKSRSQREPSAARTWTVTFEPRFDQVKSEVDPKGNVTKYVYDYEENAGDVGNLIRVEYPTVPDENGTPATPTVVYTYNAHGQVLTETDPRGVVTRYVYSAGTADEADGGSNPLFLSGVTPKPGLLTQVIEDAGGTGDLNITTVFKGFDTAGNPTIVIEPHGSTYTTVYDSMNRPILETDPLGVVTKREYNARGALSRVVDDFTLTPGAGLNVVSTFDTNLYGQIERERVGFTQAGDERGSDYFYDINRNLARTTDVLGNSTTYAYDDADQQISSTDALGNVTRYAYDERGLLASTTYPGGAVDRFVYDGFGRLVAETIDAGGLDLTTTYTYDANSNITQTTDASGTTTCHTYDALDRLVRTQRDCGGLDLTTTFVYDLAGRLVQQTDARGVVTLFGYDDADRQTLRRHDEDGLKIENRYTYAANGDMLSITDGRGTQTVFTYDPLSRLRTQTVDPGGLALVDEQRYDALGRLVAAVDANGETTTYAVNAFGETTSETDPLGNVTGYTYDAAGNLLTTTDPTGMTLRHRYDALYRPVALVNALGEQAQYAYDGRGNLVREIDPNGNATVYAYDGAQRRIRQTDALSNTTAFAYDGMGRMIGETAPLSTTHTFAYDPLGRLIEEANPLGERMLHTYDAADNRVRTVAAIPAGGNQADGQLTQFEYDGVSRLVREIDPLGNATAYEYDANGNRTATVDPLGRRTAFVYDAANRLLTVTDPLNQSTTYAYDAKGQIVSTTYANGDLLTYTYDAAGREAAVNYPDSTAIARSFDAAGRLTHVIAPVTDMRLGYDAVGRLATVDDRRMQKTIRYAYDGTGNRTQLIGPDGLTTRYTYDALDRLTQVVQGGQRIGLTYDANSRLIGQQMGDGVQMQIAYDSAGRTVEMGYQGADGTVLDQLAYTYDAAGNRTRIDYANGDVLAYAYDDANRLTGEQRTGGLSYNQTFAYDAAGNRTQLVRDGTATTYQYNAGNQLTQSSGGQNQTYTYDARSRLVGMSGDVNRTYTYNFRDEMTGTTGPDGSAAYAYDALRRRVGETVGGVTTNFLHDGVGVGTTVLAEYAPVGVLKTGYTLAPFTDGRLARAGSDGSGYYLSDGTGSTRYLADNSGGLVNRYEYDAFGQSTARQENLANPYQFAGRRWDAAADLYDNRARRYSPSLGRFVQADPLGQVEGPNLYRYAQNNPVTRVDPLGWSSTDCISVQKESDDLLGLEKYTTRISSLLKGLPSAPSVKAKGTLKAQAKVCRKCCEGPAGGDCPDCPRKDYVGSASVSASAGIAITWPLASIGFQIRSYSFKFGVEAYGKLGVTIAGGGELNYCSGQNSIKLCGTGSVAGGVKAGLLEWPFKQVKLKAYVYGELKGSCSVCIGYSLTRGVSLYSAKCQACAEIGYKLEVSFLADWVSYSREDIFAKGCIGG